MARIIKDKSYLNEFLNPFRLSLFSTIVFLIIIGLGYLFFSGLENNFAWHISASVCLFYSMFATVMLIISDNLLKSWQRSIYGFIIYLIPSMLIAYLISGISFYDLGNYRVIYVVITLSFVIFMLIGTMVRRLVEFTEYKDLKRKEKEKLHDEITKNNGNN